MLPFRPLLRNPHILTLFANFAVRRLDEHRFPIECRYYETEKDVQVLIHSQRPAGQARGEILMIHGLEGSSNAGYLKSLSQHALESGYAVHRANMRSCGGTEALCKTMYHAGLTADTRFVLGKLKEEHKRPVFLIGFSLGGNVALKLAGELAAAGRDLLEGVCAVSAPIDLAASVRKMSRRENFIYEWRFLTRLKERIRKRSRSLPGVYALEALDRVKSVYEFDDRITAPSFGFGSADNYYATQSSSRFLHSIRVPTLIIQAKDDPLIPFEIFGNDAIRDNPHIEFLAVDHGGHLGFLSHRPPHFWLDRAILHWISRLPQRSPGVSGNSDNRQPQK
ncbi:MAG: YheT family hydrolase [Bryobacteraceae bacterium]